MGILLALRGQDRGRRRGFRHVVLPRGRFPAGAPQDVAGEDRGAQARGRPGSEREDVRVYPRGEEGREARGDDDDGVRHRRGGGRDWTAPGGVHR